MGVMVASELYIAPMTYMLTPSHEIDWYQQVVELSDKIEDESFYRVKTDKSYSGRDFDVNLLGGLGYNSLGHYTSLTGGDYMQTIKNFGYTSYWMEVGNSGGTVLTDALLSVKYQISSQSSERDVYNGSYFNISKTSYSLPLGIITKEEILREEFLTRGGLQKRLYNDFFEGDGVTVYEMKDANAYRLKVEEKEGKYLLTPTGTSSTPSYLSFDLTLEANSLVYVNLFDENTNALKQAINEKFIVRAPGYYFNGYPQQKNNGLLEIGEYGAGEITVKIQVKQTVSIKEVEVVTIDTQKLASEIATTQSVDLQVNDGKIVGRYVANGGEQVFLSLPYDEGLQLKINGNLASLYKAYGGFTAFYLEEGDNEIEITFTPKGFLVGAIISMVGMVALIGSFVWFALRRRRGKTDVHEALQAWAYFGVLAVGILTVFLVYVAPMFLCAL